MVSSEGTIELAVVCSSKGVKEAIVACRRSDEVDTSLTANGELVTSINVEVISDDCIDCITEEDSLVTMLTTLVVGS